MFTENGPFVVDKDMNVTLNPYSWNTVANVLYLEQPAGVGFSYPAAPTNDTITSSDSYHGLLGFLEAHPELKARDFYITGESYGGHYM
jgi:carboxypeptidase C (cathepsin A)